MLKILRWRWKSSNGDLLLHEKRWEKRQTRTQNGYCAIKTSNQKLNLTDCLLWLYQTAPAAHVVRLRPGPLWRLVWEHSFCFLSNIQPRCWWVWSCSMSSSPHPLYTLTAFWIILPYQTTSQDWSMCTDHYWLINENILSYSSTYFLCYLYFNDQWVKKLCMPKWLNYFFKFTLFEALCV